MTINITCTSEPIWKNIYSKHESDGIPCFRSRSYWEYTVASDYELTRTIRVSYDGLCISDEYSFGALGLFKGYGDWQGIPITVSEEDTCTKLVNDIAKYVLHLTDNYLN